jgi:ankyrin repeat protein
MMAAMYGSPEAVKVLIQAGADLNIKNQLGMTALDFAVRGNRQNAKELIETGLQRLAARANSSQTRASSATATPISAPATGPASGVVPVVVAPVMSPSSSVNTESKPSSQPFKTGW